QSPVDSESALLHSPKLYQLTRSLVFYAFIAAALYSLIAWLQRARRWKVILRPQFLSSLMQATHVSSLLYNTRAASSTSAQGVNTEQGTSEERGEGVIKVGRQFSIVP
ncbi:unnamed protein product, partial [Arctogadus glacialis]